MQKIIPNSSVVQIKKKSSKNVSSETGFLQNSSKNIKSAFGKQSFPTEIAKQMSIIEDKSTQSLKIELDWKKRLDTMKNKVSNRRRYLIDLQDKLEEYSKTNTLVEDEEISNKRIKILENKVDNLMIKFNEAMNIKRMFEGLILNLKQQRTTYDKKISKMEKETLDKENEVKQAIGIFQNTIQKKQIITQKYKDYENRRDEVQAQREEHLINRKIVGSEIDNILKKDIKKNKIADEGNRLTNTFIVNEDFLKNSCLKINKESMPKESPIETVDHQSLEEFFLKIFDITGAKDGKLISKRDYSKIY